MWNFIPLEKAWQMTILPAFHLDCLPARTSGSAWPKRRTPPPTFRRFPLFRLPTSLKPRKNYLLEISKFFDMCCVVVVIIRLGIYGTKKWKKKAKISKVLLVNIADESGKVESGKNHGKIQVLKWTTLYINWLIQN